MSYTLALIVGTRVNPLAKNGLVEALRTVLALNNLVSK